MAPRPLVLIVSFLLLIGLALAPGCSDSPSDPQSGDPDPTTGPDWPDGAVALPEQDAQVLDAAADRLLELLDEHELAGARTRLLDELNDGWDEVSSAEIQADSFTVAIRFEDGAVASLTVDPAFWAAAPAKRELRSAEAKARACAAIGKVLCDGVKVAPTHKVHIVNVASGRSTAMPHLSQEIREQFIALGWDPADVVISEPAGFADPGWTPDALLDQTGYGIVLFVADGSHTAMAGAPDRSFMMQCFRGGSYEDGYRDHVTPARWDDYEQWLADGDLVQYKVFNNDTMDFMDQVFVRGEFLAGNILLEDGASVHLISDISSEAQTRWGLMDAGAGGVTAWSGLVNPWQSADAVLQLIAHQCQADEAITESEAMQLLVEDHAEAYEVYGLPTVLVPTVDPAFDFYLPAQLRFDAPFDCLPAGTQYYEVEVSYPDCPELDASFDFFPGGDYSLTGLPPVGGEIEFRAKDSAGNTLGAGAWELELTAGPNEVELCPCEGSFVIELWDVPDGADDILYDIEYADASLPDTTLFGGPDDLQFEAGGLVPGEASIRVNVFDGAEIIAIDEIDAAEIRCDGGRAAVCFGWLTFQPIEWPADTETIEVECDYFHALPSRVSMPPGGEASMYGFETFEQVDYTAYAYDGSGDLLDIKSGQRVIDCGENVVLIDFDTYGIILEASPVDAHTGWEDVTITATVREWTGYDTTEPTGDPLAGRTVFFATDLGEFTGSDFPMTDENGRAEAHLTSDEAGIAQVTATVGGVQAEVLVRFESPLSYFVDRRPVDFDGTIPSGYRDNWMEKFATDLQIRCGPYLRMDWTGDNLSYSYFQDTLPAPEDTLRFVWTPHPDVPDPEADPPYDAPFISEVWLHYWFGTDYDRQITVQVTPRQEPLSAVLEVEIVLEDPWD